MIDDYRGVVGIALFVVGSNALALLMRWGQRRKLSSQLVRVGTVESVHIFPIKSCGGIEVEEASIDATGIEAFHIRDRHFAVIAIEGDGEPGKVLTQRVIPQMANVKLRMLTKPRRGSVVKKQPPIELADSTDNSITLCFSAPDMPDLQLRLPLTSGSKSEDTEAKLWGQSIYGRNCGKEASAWWNKYLQRDDVMLIYAEKETHLKTLMTTTSKMPENVVGPRLEGDKTAYKDWSPLHILNLASLDDLNARINDTNSGQQSGPVEVRNFRPNIVIRTEVAYEEDKFDRIYIARSAADVETQAKTVTVLRGMKLTGRCLLTTVNPDKGERRPDGEPLKTLRSFRTQEEDYGKSPVFGINACIDRPGKVCKGDVVYITRMH